MDPLIVAQIVVAALQDLLFAIAAGALACSALCSPRGQLRGLNTQPRDACLSSGRVRFASLCMLVLACCVYLQLEAAVMSGSTFVAAGSVVGAVLTQSHFGVAWSIGCGGAVVACLGGHRDSRTAWWLAAAGMLAYVAGKAAASHAADAGDFTLREAVHVVHLCATALWAGSVIIATPTLRRWSDAASHTAEEIEGFCTRLSHLATMALVVVILTGIYNATQDTAHLAAPLLSVLYGRILALKLVFVTLAVLLGGYNRMVYLPRLQVSAIEGGAAYSDAQRCFNRLLTIEAVAMVAVLAVAGVLGHTSPSGG
ncbi:MAG: CopD family protein [Paraburkholderia sp.]|uniref:CopD family protein n=1 Tax=Paraburkholderia sp. TaxID=1926495 RepID=UPI003C5DC475